MNYIIFENNYNFKKYNGWYIANDKVECICDGKIEKLKIESEMNYEYK